MQKPIEKDPVSGNEVPPGSLPEEVRDDVDAKLSEGEYVVPADVLRYYGVKFFEDLRSEAKGNLEQMDSEGRIGGDTSPSPDAVEGELSPGEMQLLEQMMAEGGGQETPAFNEGGVVDLNSVMFNPSSWETVGSSFSSSNNTTANTGSFFKTYKGPNGEYRMILFVDGKPSTPIPEGFTEVDDAASEEQEETAQELPSFDGAGQDITEEETETETDSEAGNSWAEANREAITSDPIGFGLAASETGTAGKVGVAAATVFGGIGLGGVANVATQGYNIAEMHAAQREATAQGLDTTSLDAKINEAIGNLPIGIRDLAEKGQIFSGKNFTRSLASTALTSTTDDQGSPLAPSSSARPQARPPSPSTTTGSSGSTGSSSGSSSGNDDGGLAGYGGMNKGGLASKKRPSKKTKPKGKGLATKTK